MKVRYFPFAMVLAILLAPSPLRAADMVYVQSLKAKILSSPEYKAEVKGLAARGDALTLLEKKGDWYRVSIKGIEGWLHRLSVSDSPPMGKVMVITENTKDLMKDARKRASAITSAAASRGLSDEDRKRLSDLGKADYASLEKLEEFGNSITEKEVGDFSRGEP